MASARESDILATFFPQKITQGQKTKLKILRHSVTFLATMGLQNLTFQAIGKKIGLNASQVKYHFRDLDELVLETLRFSISHAQVYVTDRLKGASGWESQIEALYYGFFDWVIKEPHQGRLLLMLYYLSRVHPYRELSKQLSEMGYRRCHAILKEAKELRRWNEKTLERRTLQVWALLEGYFIYATMGMSALTWKTAGHEAVISLREILRK